MDPPKLEFHPRAVAEARAARRWYAHRSGPVAARFLAELDRAVARIASAPGCWPVYLYETRVYRLPRFPYLIVYQDLDDVVQVLAVAHDKRKPGYWKRRLP